jgi:ParE toxin of type II toxin-antitoxin system, parDE
VVKSAAPSAARTTLRFTPNLEANLSHIEKYWADNQFPAGFDRLMAELLDTVIPNLENHPRFGRRFFERQAQTLQAQEKMQAVAAHLAKVAADAELREYVMIDYTMLYALIASTIYLLAIKHHKQLVFDVTQV